MCRHIRCHRLQRALQVQADDVAGIIGATGLARLCTIFWYEPKVLFHRTFGRSAAAYFKAQGGLLLLNGAVMALSLSGLPPHPFLFLGFLPANGGPRAAELARLRAVVATVKSTSCSASARVG